MKKEGEERLYRIFAYVMMMVMAKRDFACSQYPMLDL